MSEAVKAVIEQIQSEMVDMADRLNVAEIAALAKAETQGDDTLLMFSSIFKQEAKQVLNRVQELDNLK